MNAYRKTLVQNSLNVLDGLRKCGVDIRPEITQDKGRRWYWYRVWHNKRPIAGLFEHFSDALSCAVATTVPPYSI